jgi:NADPH-dependent ferric siderophore reductase
MEFMNTRTPIQEHDQKLDIIDHISQDHAEELLTMAQSHYPQHQISTATILDLFHEGILVGITFGHQQHQDEIFIPFQIEGDLEEKILYLAYAAIVEQGRDFTGTGKRFFEITDTQKVSHNFIRLTVQCATPLPDDYPGYAYAFMLKSMQKSAGADTIARAKKPWLKSKLDSLFIWLMKHLSSQRRQKLLQNINKDIRLYTLRKSWQSPSAAFVDQGYVDIYTHDDSPGSQWARGLRVGDVILSRSESADQHPHLAKGQALLVADETAYPAIAGILERWQNPLPPQLVIMSTTKGEQDYFHDTQIPAGTVIHKVVCSAQEQADKVIPILAAIKQIDVAWSACESESAKKIRHYLRNERQVTGRQNHSKGYWHLNSKRGALG